MSWIRRLDSRGKKKERQEMNEDTRRFPFFIKVYI